MTREQRGEWREDAPFPDSVTRRLWWCDRCGDILAFAVVAAFLYLTL